MKTLDTTAYSKQLIFKTDSDEDTEEWKRKDLKDWTSNDVMHWIANVAESQKFPYEFINANAFNVDGKTLLSLTKKEFLESDEKYGNLLYHALHRSMHKFEDITSLYKFENGKNDVKLETLTSSSNMPQDFISPLTMKNSDNEPFSYGLIRPSETYSNELNNNNNNSASEPYPFEFNLTRVVENSTTTTSTSTTCEDGKSDLYVSSDTEQSDVEIKKQTKKFVNGKRPPGRPPGMKGKKEKAEKKSGRLWEFIRDLLLDPKHCPSVICWENHDDGVFRFVKSEKVAKIWGDRKGNEKMNYEKLSRAMRSKVLQPVLGRRLVYKFGPTAKGWKTENPNFRH
ncbi:epithelium specific ets factor 3, ese3, putative [Pediculus humanus corporis]|uniref:Epithelium specific ets factor 3, ese3, putative n=1 Tax=Pediculus humanus subsp. corporis TaxID=121224 RepID=E0VBI4_PEDHC|nr:epithelium specific ets factor 3, ese3, putative [Pediculus humanus corporis]EEB10740.1 epithelium specific ets factor 3, ese3, putative [Pediculus humanus corporis]